MQHKPANLYNETNIMISEFEKCKNDPIYFIENYCHRIDSKEGWVKYKLNQHQRNLIDTRDDKVRLVVSSRQEGTDTIINAFIVWRAVFHQSGTAIIEDRFGNTIKSISEILNSLPENFLTTFSLQNGNKSLLINSFTEIQTFNSNATFSTLWSKKKAAYENRAGFSIQYEDKFDLVLVNNASYEEKNDWCRVHIPEIITEGSSKVLVIGYDHGPIGGFYDLWKHAIIKNQPWTMIKTTWQTNGTKDRAWKQDMLRNVGYKNFNQQFNCANYME